MHSVSLNQSDQHFISPVIFHDEQKEGTQHLTKEDTILGLMLKNPLLLFAFIIFGYYIYPTLWRKEYFMALGEEFNDSTIGNMKRESDVYDYINYRRGLYVNVRSNFS